MSRPEAADPSGRIRQRITTASRSTATASPQAEHLQHPVFAEEERAEHHDRDGGGGGGHDAPGGGQPLPDRDGGVAVPAPLLVHAREQEHLVVHGEAKDDDEYHDRHEGLEERALRTQREVDRERRLAAAEERTRIARELHDSAGHAINVILVQAGAARLLHERNTEGSRAAIATIEEVARITITDIDQLVRALREDTPAESRPADPAALEELVARHRAAGLSVATDVRGPQRPLSRPRILVLTTFEDEDYVVSPTWR